MLVAIRTCDAKWKPASRPRITTGKPPGNPGLTLCIQDFPCHSVYRGLRSSVSDTEHPRKAPPLSVSQPGSPYSIHCVYKFCATIQCIAASEALPRTLNTPEKRRRSVYYDQRTPGAPLCIQDFHRSLTGFQVSWPDMPC